MRQVVTRRNREAILFGRNLTGDDRAPLDTYRERLVKYIPSETIVVYVALYGIGYAIWGPDPAFILPARWLILAGIICTPLYLWKAEGVTDWLQVLISTVAFAVWTAALGVIPVSDIAGYNQIAASVLLLVYTFGVPLLDGIPEAL